MFNSFSFIFTQLKRSLLVLGLGFGVAAGGLAALAAWLGGRAFTAPWLRDGQ